MNLCKHDFLIVTALGAVMLGAATLAIPGCSAPSRSSSLGTPPTPYLDDPSEPPYPTQVADAQEAAAIALAMVKNAMAQYTFAVGGVIVETSTGRVIKAMHNNVIRELPQENGSAFTWDQTAHGERQLVSWYYAHAKSLSLPPPEQLTIVTSLDPCAQCAGSLMTAGFKAGVIAFDDVAGVNYTLDSSFTGLPERFRSLAKSTFGYYAINPGRVHSGSSTPVYSNTPVLSKTAAGCLDIFVMSRTVVESVRKSGNLAPELMTDPNSLPQDSPVRTALIARFPQAFTLRLANYRQPDEKLLKLLQDLKDSTAHAQNAVALIDPFGNLVAISPDTFDISPINTGFMNVVEGYSQARYDLAANPATKKAGEASLTNPKYGTFVWLHAPSPDQTTTIKDLGIYDLTIEGTIPVLNPSNFQYYRPPVSGTAEELRSMINTMAPWTDPADPQPVTSHNQPPAP